MHARVEWPNAPRGLEELSDKLMRMYDVWRAKKILENLPMPLRNAFREKVTAFEALQGRRPKWGYSRHWKGNYLELVRLSAFSNKIMPNLLYHTS